MHVYTVPAQIDEEHAQNLKEKKDTKEKKIVVKTEGDQQHN